MAEFEEQFKNKTYEIVLVVSSEALWSACKEKAEAKLTSGKMNPFKAEKKKKAVISWHSGGESICDVHISG